MSVESWRYLASGDEAHVYPVGDLVDHRPLDCTCGPRTEPLERPDGSFGWVIVHHSLDGRERNE